MISGCVEFVISQVDTHQGSIIFKSTAYLDICTLYSFSFVQVFPTGFYWQGFNEAVFLVRPTSLLDL